MEDLQPLPDCVISETKVRALSLQQDAQQLDGAIDVAEPLEHLDHVPGGGVGVLPSKVRQVLVNLQRLGDVREALVAGVLVPHLLQWRHL